MKGRILVVGASGGIGRSAAAELIARRHRVVATVMDATEQASLRADLPEIEDVFVVNLADSQRARTVFEDILKTGDGTLDAAVGCAGFATFGPIETSTMGELRAIMEVNAFANVALYQAVMPYLRRSRGRIIIVSSYAGQVGFPLFSQYSASKHALEAFMNVARLEASQWGVSVSLIVPGGVRTEMTKDLSGKLDAQLGRLDTEAVENYGAYFTQYKNLMEVSVNSFIEPRQVTDAIMVAIEATQPQPRYLVGEDAIDLIRNKKELSDIEFDEYIRTIFPGNSALI
jgi:short-subunit dehydrogenase